MHPRRADVRDLACTDPYHEDNPGYIVVMKALERTVLAGT